MANQNLPHSNAAPGTNSPGWPYASHQHPPPQPHSCNMGVSSIAGGGVMQCSCSGQQQTRRRRCNLVPNLVPGSNSECVCVCGGEELLTQHVAAPAVLSAPSLSGHATNGDNNTYSPYEVVGRTTQPSKCGLGICTLRKRYTHFVTIGECLLCLLP